MDSVKADILKLWLAFAGIAIFQIGGFMYLNHNDVDSRPLIDQMNETGTVAVQEEIRPKLTTVEARLVKLEKGDVAQMTQRVDQHDDRLKNITARLRKVEDYVAVSCLGLDANKLLWYQGDPVEPGVLDPNTSATEPTPDGR